MPVRENRQVRLVARPRRIPQPEHFSLVTEPVAALALAGKIVYDEEILCDPPAYRGENHGKLVIAMD